MLLSIESSCDETACSLFDYNSFLNNSPINTCIIDEVVSSQMLMHSEYGGVVPELASREHLKNLPTLVSMLLDRTKMSMNDITMISVTAGPGLKGCLLVGVSYAKGIALARNLPLYPVNHLEGHILSGFSSLSKNDLNSKLPALALLVSGGHTQLVYIKSIGDYEILANTNDDAAGEAFDKIGTLLGMSYPAGKEVSEKAKMGKAIYELPKVMASDPASYSFSGLKTAASLLIKKTINDPSLDIIKFKQDFSASIQNAIVDALVSKLEFWVNKLLINNSLNSIVLCGGVAANNLLQEEFKKIGNKYNLPTYIPPFSLCTDNAAMISIATALRICFRNEHPSFDAFEVKARWPLA